ncbi:hypothetical protein YC2023_049011 [Brassica napus]
MVLKSDSAADLCRYFNISYGDTHTSLKFPCLVKSYKDENVMKLRDVGFHDTSLILFYGSLFRPPYFKLPRMWVLDTTPRIGAAKEEENKITWLLDYTEDDTATTSTEGFISSFYPFVTSFSKAVVGYGIKLHGSGGDMYKNVHESKAHDNELLAVSQQIQRPKLCVCWVEAVDVKGKMEGSQISCEWFHSPRRKKGSFRLLSLCLWL